MRKILLGISALVSLTFLSACGGGGAGSSGAAGANGADGAAGTIALPSAGTLAIEAVSATYDGTGDSLDINTTMGTVVRNFKISGADALLSDSRQRYYVYEGTSASTKSDSWNKGSSLSFTGANTIYQASATPTGAAMFDSRGITAGDNITVTTEAVAMNVIDGTVSHMIICPGNEAGDAASCASVALNDRGGQTSTLVDNTTELAMAFAIGSGFGVIRDHSASAFVYGETLSYSKGVANVGSGVISAQVASGKTPAGTFNGFDMTSTGGTNAYMISLGTGDSDNFTLSKISASGLTNYNVDNITSSRAAGDVNQGAASVRISETSAGVIYTTVHWNDNSTLSAFTIDASGNATDFGADNYTFSGNGPTNLSAVTNGHCSAVHPSGGSLVVGYRGDNQSMFTSLTTGGAWAANTQLTDNNTVSVGLHGPIKGADNATLLACDMAYASDGKVWFTAVADNRTGINTWVSTDNGSSWTNIVVNETALTGDKADIAVVIDTDTLLPVVAVNSAGSIQLRALDNSSGSYSWNTLGNTASVAGSRVGLAAQSDGSKFAVSGESSASDNSSVTIFYDE